MHPGVVLSTRKWKEFKGTYACSCLLTKLQNQEANDNTLIRGFQVAISEFSKFTIVVYNEKCFHVDMHDTEFIMQDFLALPLEECIISHS
jgi:hypothetical protein